MSERPIIQADHFPLFEVDNAHLVKQRLQDWLLLSRDSSSENTFRAYVSDWRHFWDWCQYGEDIHGQRKSYDQQPLTAHTIIDYIKVQIGLAAPATIRHRLSTINKIIGAAGIESPFNDELVKQAKKLIGRHYNKKPSQPGSPPTFYELKLKQLERLGLSEKDLHENLAGNQRQARGFKLEHLALVKEALPVKGFIWQQRKQARARALIFLAYDSLCRVSELVNINRKDIEFHDQVDELGRRVTIGTLRLGQRKDNPEGEADYAYISAETALELQNWFKLAEIYSGPVFCSFTRNGRNIQKEDGVQKRLLERNVLDVYKSVARAIGVDASLFSCHSTRVGAAQDMLEGNVSQLGVMHAGRWKSSTMPARYGKRANVKESGMAQLSRLKGR